VQLTDFANCHGCNFTSPPVLAGDMLTFGSTGGELATAGKIYGVDADSGKKLWEFETIKRDPKSWPGESGKYGGGGAWMPGTYDAETNTVFYGTGNPGKDFVGADREGDNLYTDSVVALDAKTGGLKWYRQEIEHDVWDYDAPYESPLLKKDGKDLLVHLKTGLWYADAMEFCGAITPVAEDRPEGLRHRAHRLRRFRQAAAGAGAQARSPRCPRSFYRSAQMDL
jgi:alcohol dehydrogenase (cytochrome c)